MNKVEAGSQRHDGTAGFAGAGSSGLVAAVAIGVIQVALTISMAAMIFAGPLAAGLPRATAAYLIGSLIVCLVVGLRTSMTVVVARVQDTGAVVLVAVAVSMAGALPAGSDELISTVVVTTAICVVLTGLFAWFVGNRGYASLVRYLPWPVIAGFNAGTGWLLLRGGVEVMHGSPLGLGQIDDLFDGFIKLVPGLVLALVIVGIVNTRVSNTAVGVAILASTVLFHLVAAAITSIDVLETEGWLVGPFADQAGWRPVMPSDLGHADWGLIAAHGLPIAAVVAVSILGMLLNLSGLEAGIDTPVDFDRELTSVGAANLAAAAAGGMSGWHLLGDTTLAHRLGAKGRIVPLTVAALIAVVLALGPEMVSLLPRAIAGGVLAGVGLNLLVEWARHTVPQLNRADRALTTSILVAIAALGVLRGVAIGVAAAVVVFVTRSSLIDPVRHMFAAAGASNVERPASQVEVLGRRPGAILAVELSGFLFFGSARRLRQMLADQISPTDPPRFVLFDFSRVSGIDSTAATAVVHQISSLRNHEIQVRICGASEAIGAELTRNELPHELAADGHGDLDHAVAECEEILLSDAPGSSSSNGHQGAGDLRQVLADSALAEVTERRVVLAGDKLICAGDRDRCLFVIESGSFAAWRTDSQGRSTRLREMQAGSVLGEISFNRGGRRTADVVAQQDSVVLCLDRDRFDIVAHEDPLVALRLQTELGARLAERLAHTSKIVNELRY